MLPDPDDGDQGDGTRSTLLAAQTFLAAMESRAAQASPASQTPPEAHAPFRTRLEFLIKGIVPFTDPQDADCTICTGALAVDVVKFVRCGRFFHCKCILAWLHGHESGHAKCSVCQDRLFVRQPGPHSQPPGRATYTYSDTYAIAALAEIRYRLIYGGPATLFLPFVDEENGTLNFTMNGMVVPVLEWPANGDNERDPRFYHGPTRSETSSEDSASTVSSDEAADTVPPVTQHWREATARLLQANAELTTAMVDMEATTTAFFSMSENLRATSSARLNLDAAMLDLLATNTENLQIDDQEHELNAH